MHMRAQGKKPGIPILMIFLMFFDYVDGNNGRRHVAYIEMLILAGPTATFWWASKWWHAKENLTRSRIVSLAGATATFCEIINFRNPEL